MASLDAPQGDDTILARKLLTLRRETPTFTVKNLGASMPVHHKRPYFPVPARAHFWGDGLRETSLDDLIGVSKMQGLYHLRRLAAMGPDQLLPGRTRRLFCRDSRDSNQGPTPKCRHQWHLEHLPRGNPSPEQETDWYDPSPINFASVRASCQKLVRWRIKIQGCHLLMLLYFSGHSWFQIYHIGWHYSNYSCNPVNTHWEIWV